MRRFRLVTVGIVVVSCFFLSGFKHSDRHHLAVIKKHESDKPVQQKQKKLDLTLPSDHDSLKVKSEIVPQVQKDTEQVTFSKDDDNKTSAIELKGNVIMSQEPEAGKIKSADGAGIMVNLHP